MKRRKTVSVTPAMGARTVAGAMRTLPICNSAGTLALGRHLALNRRCPLLIHSNFL